jgi:hypothetical protein
MSICLSDASGRCKTIRVGSVPASVHHTESQELVAQQHLGAIS